RRGARSLPIDLAATRLRISSLPPLLAHLEHPLHQLTGGPRDLPARQQTLHATIAWSYELLSAEEQRLFRLLSVFANGGTLEAAEAISGVFGSETTPVLDLVLSLGDKHLLFQMRENDETVRLMMLETIRECAQEDLARQGEAARARQAHAAYYLRLAEAADAHPYQKHWLDCLEREHDNLRAALTGFIEWEQG